MRYARSSCQLSKRRREFYLRFLIKQVYKTTNMNAAFWLYCKTIVHEVEIAIVLLESQALDTEEQQFLEVCV
jgi:hypothetical protein